MAGYELLRMAKYVTNMSDCVHAYVHVRRRIQDLFAMSVSAFNAGERRKALGYLHCLRELELTQKDSILFAKVAYNSALTCSDDDDLDVSIDWMRVCFGMANDTELCDETRVLKTKALISLAELYTKVGQLEAAKNCLDLVPTDTNPFLKHILKLNIVIQENQVNKGCSGMIDDYFARCLSAANFDSLEKVKQLLSLLISRKLDSTFKEATYVCHLFEEAQNKVDLSEHETEELLSLQLIYHLERSCDYDQAFRALSMFIEWYNRPTREKTDDSSPCMLRILDFGNTLISELFFPTENFSAAKKWSSALVFLSQLAGQPKDRFLYFLVMSWSEN